MSLRIQLTNDYMRRAAAKAVPGAWLDASTKYWMVTDPEPRAAVVALKLFPELMHKYPELVELRDATLQNAKPVDYATKCNIRISASGVRAEMAKRGWSLSQAKAVPINGTSDFQEIDLGYGAACLKQHKGFYLGWSRGFGKTLGTAALIDELGLKRTIVIAPNSAKAVTWADELAWACPWLEVLTLPNDVARRTRCLERAQYLNRSGAPFVLIVHFEALALIAGKKTHRKNRKTGALVKLKTVELLDGWKKLGIRWQLVAADEGHRLANPDSQQSRAARKLRALSDMAMVMSGSVFQNRWEELFGVLRFLFPERYKSRWSDWNDRFIDYVENGYGKIAVGLLPDRIDAMRDELGRFMVVRDKESKAITHTITVPLTAEQRRVYDDMVATLFTELPDGQRLKAGVGIAVLTRLRQIACGLDVFNPEELHDSSKLDATVAEIQKHLPRGDDFVVFGWYKASLTALQRRLAEVGIDSWMINGDIPQKERTRIIRAFQAGEKRVLLGSIPTMGESVNLQRANHVIRVDRSYNPALNQQAVDRVDRQGQERECYLTDIVAEHTVDDLQVMPNLANKEALRAVVFGGQSCG